MSGKRTILIGTFILTATGLLTRFIGFFFRMFLSHTFGEEQVGLYQLIFPIYALCFSLTSAGIETALSRCTAHKISLGRKNEAIHLLYIGISLSLILSFATMVILQSHATDFSIYILGDIRCEPMLLAISYAIPFASIHSCICGYYLGLKQTKIPAISQLIEQLVRVGTVFIIYQTAMKHKVNTNILFAVLGIVAGECFSSLFCFHCFRTGTKKISHNNSFLNTKTAHNFSISNTKALCRELLQLAIPLTSSRILLNILQSVESISTPLRLQQYGYTTSAALSNYGVLTGMALPCVLFPTAVTNSISTMLLPTVAEIQATEHYSKLREVVYKVFISCLSLGLFCCFIFLLLGNFMGNVLFHSELAGNYLQTLAWICPFLYLNSTLISITNGLGKANVSFIINTLGLAIRIIGVLVFIPRIGMNGYLWGLLLSQFVTFVLCLLHLSSYLKKRTL